MSLYNTEVQADGFSIDNTYVPESNNQGENKALGIFGGKNHGKSNHRPNDLHNLFNEVVKHCLSKLPNSVQSEFKSKLGGFLDNKQYPKDVSHRMAREICDKFTKVFNSNRNSNVSILIDKLNNEIPRYQRSNDNGSGNSNGNGNGNGNSNNNGNGNNGNGGNGGSKTETVNVQAFTLNDMDTSIGGVMLARVVGAMSFFVALKTSAAVAASKYTEKTIVGGLTPPSLQSLILPSMGMELVFNLIGLALVYSVASKITSLRVFAIQMESDMYNILIDIAVGFALKYTALYIIAGTVSDNTYFDYNNNGLKAITAYTSLALPVGTILSAIPYSLCLRGTSDTTKHLHSKIGALYSSIDSVHQDLDLFKKTIEKRERTGGCPPLVDGTIFPELKGEEKAKVLVNLKGILAVVTAPEHRAIILENTRDHNKRPLGDLSNEFVAALWHYKHSYFFSILMNDECRPRDTWAYAPENDRARLRGEPDFALTKDYQQKGFVAKPPVLKREKASGAPGAPILLNHDTSAATSAHTASGKVLSIADGKAASPTLPGGGTAYFNQLSGGASAVGYFATESAIWKRALCISTWLHNVILEYKTNDPPDVRAKKLTVIHKETSKTLEQLHVSPNFSLPVDYASITDLFQKKNVTDATKETVTKALAAMDADLAKKQLGAKFLDGGLQIVARPSMSSAETHVYRDVDLPAPAAAVKKAAGDASDHAAAAAATAVAAAVAAAPADVEAVKVVSTAATAAAAAAAAALVGPTSIGITGKKLSSGPELIDLTASVGDEFLDILKLYNVDLPNTDPLASGTSSVKKAAISKLEKAEVLLTNIAEAVNYFLIDQPNATKKEINLIEASKKASLATIAYLEGKKTSAKTKQLKDELDPIIKEVGNVFKLPLSAQQYFIGELVSDPWTNLAKVTRITEIIKCLEVNSDCCGELHTSLKNSTVLDPLSWQYSNIRPQDVAQALASYGRSSFYNSG